MTDEEEQEFWDNYLSEPTKTTIVKREDGWYACWDNTSAGPYATEREAQGRALGPVIQPWEINTPVDDDNQWK